MTTTFEMSKPMYYATLGIKQLLNIGLPMGSLRLLRHRGRKSGTMYQTPVALVQQDRSRWLVSPFGEVNWVLNVRANGYAQLKGSFHTETIKLIELDNTLESAPILKQFRTQYGIVPFIPPHFQATPQSSIQDFVAEAHQHPVFLIQ